MVRQAALKALSHDLPNVCVGVQLGRIPGWHHFCGRPLRQPVNISWGFCHGRVPGSDLGLQRYSPAIQVSSCFLLSMLVSAASRNFDEAVVLGMQLVLAPSEALITTYSFSCGSNQGLCAIEGYHGAYRFSDLNLPPKNWTFACHIDTYGIIKVCHPQLIAGVLHSLNSLDASSTKAQPDGV